MSSRGAPRDLGHHRLARFLGVPRNEIPYVRHNFRSLNRNFPRIRSHVCLRPNNLRTFQSTMANKIDAFGSVSSLSTAAGEFKINRLDALEKQGFCDLDKVPFSIKVLLESAPV